jgi:hypothetical protein
VLDLRLRKRKPRRRKGFLGLCAEGGCVYGHGVLLWDRDLLVVVGKAGKQERSQGYRGLIVFENEQDVGNCFRMLGTASVGSDWLDYQSINNRAN